jgi:hypothetical protein
VTVKSEGLCAHRLAPGAQDEGREETVSALKETKVEYKIGAYYCHMMTTIPNNVV